MSFCPACQADFPDDYSQCPHDGTTLLSGPLIGKYKIVGRIGEGGMGAVYRAVNPDTRAEVAVKLLHARAAANASIRARFQREAEAVAALRTRHVIRIFDFGNDEHTLYLVMELLEGRTLREHISAQGAMPLAEAARILDGALRGLSAAHRIGVTHRDLKPENIFLADTEDGEVIKVLDFGIARVADTNLTDTGQLIGTPAYMAPEQVATSFGEVGPQTDCFAMGVIAYEMLTGVSPFLVEGSTSSVNEVLGRVVDGSCTPLAELRPDLDPTALAFVDRAMTDAADRFQSATEMREELVRIAPASAALSGTASSTGAKRSEGTNTTVGQLGTQRGTQRGTDLQGEREGQIRDNGSPSRLRWFFAAGGLAAVSAVAVLLATRSAAESPKDPAPAPAPVAPLEAGNEVPTVEQPVDPTSAAPENMVRVEASTVETGSTFSPTFKMALAQGEATVSSFWIDLFEVHDETRRPLTGVTLAQAQRHCEKLGKRLPTELEWEVAARRGDLSGGRFRAAKKSERRSAEVGTHPKDKTRDGVFDLLGNVAEWTATRWEGDLAKNIVRGSSFTVSDRGSFNSTIHARVPVSPTQADVDIGFRCASSDPIPPGVK